MTPERLAEIEAAIEHDEIGGGESERVHDAAGELLAEVRRLRAIPVHGRSPLVRVNFFAGTAHLLTFNYRHDVCLTVGEIIILDGMPGSALPPWSRYRVVEVQRVFRELDDCLNVEIYVEPYTEPTEGAQ